MAIEDKKQEQQKEDKRIDRMVEVIDNASRHARMVYYLYLGFIAYCAVTVFSTTDRQLALKGDTAQLPILDISVPLDGFFILAPILAVGLFVYFMLYLHRLNSLVDDLIKADPLYNKRALYPWMINIAKKPEEGVIGSLQKLFVGLTLWFTLPITLFIFALKFIKKHEEFLSFLIVAIAFFSIFIVFWFWNKINGDNYNKEIIDKFLGVVIGLIWVSFIFVIVVNEGYFKWANLDLRNELLVTVPDDKKDFEGVYWADLEGVNLNGADLTSAVLKRANLKNAELNKAVLYKANLQEANLEGAYLQKADLKSANLQESNFNDANLQGANLVLANLQKADLESANLQGAYLFDANLKEANLIVAKLQGANLRRANLQGADLGGSNLKNANLIDADLKDADLSYYIINNADGSKERILTNLEEADLQYANLQGANLFDANLKEATLSNAKLQGANLTSVNLQGAYLGNANLQEANLYFADLQGAYLFGANLQGANLWKADLQGATNLKPEQLCSAATLLEAKIYQEKFFIYISKECADKLTPKGIEEWWKKWDEKQRQKWQEKAEDKNQGEKLNTQEKLLKMQEEIITIQKTLLEENNKSESTKSE